MHLLGASLRIDLHIIAMLECQIICFSPVSLCPRVLVIILSYALGLRNPSAFSCAVVFSHAYMTPSTYIINAFLTQVQ